MMESPHNRECAQATKSLATLWRQSIGFCNAQGTLETRCFYNHYAQELTEPREVVQLLTTLTEFDALLSVIQLLLDEAGVLVP
jgi:hypothetical protein